MDTSPITQHHPQAWSWESSMNPYHHHNYQVEQEEEAHSYEREHMFEKPLTPSDVGKLNRLVIPKQHAEKYFPLDGDSGEKGLLLSFEDESGKAWRFRYSYWTSSQSYVLTKGWSRFVKEKRLDAGDVVLFERPRAGGDRLYIGCRRRGEPDAAAIRTVARTNAAIPWNPAYCNSAASASSPSNNSYFYIGSVQQDCFLHADAGGQRDEAAAVAPPPAGSKRLRLFGVNLECGPDRPEPQPVQPALWVMGQSHFVPTNASGSQL